MASPKTPSLLWVAPKNKHGGVRLHVLFFVFAVGKGLGVMATPSLARKRVIKFFSLNWNFLFPSLITTVSSIRGRLEGNLRVAFFSSLA